MDKPLEVTPEDYFNVLAAVSSSFLETQPNFTHTLIFRNRLYVCRYEPADESLHVPNLDEDYFYKFLGEFAMFALETTLNRMSAEELVLHTPTGFDFTVRLLPNEKIGIRKAVSSNNKKE
jgi:hypothetical protein